LAREKERKNNRISPESVRSQFFWFYWKTSVTKSNWKDKTPLLIQCINCLKQNLCSSLKNPAPPKQKNLSKRKRKNNNFTWICKISALLSDRFYWKTSVTKSELEE
jgi:hypothetical protein